jgi:hypothetical protein
VLSPNERVRRHRIDRVARDQAAAIPWTWPLVAIVSVLASPSSPIIIRVRDPAEPTPTDAPNRHADPRDAQHQPDPDTLPIVADEYIGRRFADVEAKLGQYFEIVAVDGPSPTPRQERHRLGHQPDGNVKIGREIAGLGVPGLPGCRPVDTDGPARAYAAGVPSTVSWSDFSGPARPVHTSTTTTSRSPTRRRRQHLRRRDDQHVGHASAPGT